MTALLARILARAFVAAENNVDRLEFYGWGGGAWTGRS
jgi:hypothetical protein